jgi:hypothetical protein
MTTHHVSTKIDAKFCIIAFLIGAEKYVSYLIIQVRSISYLLLLNLIFNSLM